jgi:hypothetical protein
MRILFCIIIFLSSVHSHARDFHAFAGLGTTLAPSTLRFGYGDWEGGMINQSFGFNKIFDFNSGYYSSFGFLIDGSTGFYSGMGLKTHLWFIPIRCELAASIRTNGDSYASGLIGVTYGF